MTLPKDLPIEPMSDVRWARVEREVFAQLDEADAAPSLRLRRAEPPRWRWAFGLVMAGAAAAVVGGFAFKAVLWPPPVTAPSPSRIVTADRGSHVDLRSAGLDLGPNSAVLVSGDDDHGILLVLDHGSVECEVAPREARPPFVVQAGEVSVRVVGTHFRVTRHGEAADVAVAKGVVEVTGHGERNLVRAGEVWPPGAPSAVTPSEGASEATTAAVGAPGEPTSGEPADQPAGQPETKPRASRPPALPAAPPPSAPPSAPIPQTLYESAARLEAKQPEQALSIYRDLAKGDGPWAANALFAEGRLEADQGHREGARRLLEAYLARFPRGANAEDARQLLARIQ